MGRFDPLIRRVFFVAVIVWAAVIVAAPALIDPGGAVRSVLAFAIYTGCSAICHQRPERSFHLFGHQMPVCARCAGIYVGAAIAALVAAVVVPKRSSRYAAVSLAVVAALPSLATLVYEWTTGDMPSNWLRAAAGMPMGVAVSWLVEGQVN